MKPKWFGLFSLVLILLIAFYVGCKAAKTTDKAALTVMPEGTDPLSPVLLDFMPSREPMGGTSGESLTEDPLSKRRASHTLGLAVPGQMILRANDREAYQRMLLGAGVHGAEVLRQLDALYAVQLQVNDLEKLAAWVTRNGYDLSANYFVHSPPAPKIEPESLESFSPTGTGLDQWLNVDDLSGSGVSIAVLDSGISVHPTFQSTEIIRLEGAGDVYANGHGTAVASLIAGTHPQAQGVAPGVTLLDFPVLDNQGIGDTFVLAAQIVAAADSGARVMNLSLGATGDSALVREAVAYAQARDVIIVAAAGNEGMEQLILPAFLPGVVAVGAVDANGQIMPFSNRGTELDVVAPGYQVQAAWPEERLIQMTGTSGAVPIVSGALANLLAREPDLSGTEAVEILQAYSNEAGILGVDADYGYGVMDLERMLYRNMAGIYDVAVVSQHLDPSQPGQLKVLIQNQGTETLYGVHVKTESNGVRFNYFIQQLQPGEVAVRSQGIHTRHKSEMEFITEVSGAFSDHDEANNRLQTVIGLQ